MEKTSIKAYGKVNIGLDVIERLPNGYHTVKMIMQTVDVYDIVTLEAEKSEELTVSITCNHPMIPTDERNIAYKAAKRIADEFCIRANIRIDIEKNIPVEAGMAGGSTDAAAVITAMNDLFRIELSEEKKDEIAVKLGADVPFCLRKGTYLSEGIGEKLVKLPDLPKCYMVIIKPSIGISTAWAYNEIDGILDRSDNIHPDIDGIISGLKKNDLYEASKFMKNIFELVAVTKYPEIAEIKEKMMSSGAVTALMSGSGPTVFGIFDDEAKAEEALTKFDGGIYGKFKVEF